MKEALGAGGLVALMKVASCDDDISFRETNDFTKMFEQNVRHGTNVKIPVR